MMTEQATDQLRNLLQKENTLVLATADPQPWTAPVYFLYRRGRFYFISAPHSRHVTAALAVDSCAATVFHGGDNWRDIEGVQMDGRIAKVRVGKEAAIVFAEYVKKFPTVREFLSEAVGDLPAFLRLFHAELYEFIPATVHYVNNRLGFARRQAVQLPD
jgi:uncharacterized protein YhbP (UPF0306 family)